jgi:hypothetical protein
MEQGFRLEGPVENVAGQLTIRIPLNEGGDQFVHCTRRIAVVDLEHDCLNIMIPKWLAKKAGISEGTIVVISNEGGKFHLQLAESN